MPEATTQAADAPVMPPGVLQGGWEFVGGAYGATWLVLLGYFISLWARRPRGTESSR